MMRVRVAVTLLCSALIWGAVDAEEDTASYEAELIFPLENWHNHASCIVECPNGDLLVCWYHGSGERRADDVRILGARKVKTTGKWTQPFVLADTPGFPDVNPCMIVDQEGRLWLFWATIQANTWESALMKYKTSSSYTEAGEAPEWDIMEVLHVKPGDDFAEKVRAKTGPLLADAKVSRNARRWAEGIITQAEDKLTRRIGWFARAHPKFLPDGRLLLGLYSDGFSFSLAAFTDNLGRTWQFSGPIIGFGNIQPSFALRKDGTVLAYMRDNGPFPKKVHVSSSSDRGETWGPVTDHPQLNNPGSGLEVANLEDGDWICVYNDEPMGRHSLAVSISDDEGATWKWTRHLELMQPGVGSFHYPSVIQDREGFLHVSYSFFLENPKDGMKKGKAIKHARFNKAWILQGDPSSQKQ